jgi:hypothetical protein
MVLLDQTNGLLMLLGQTQWTAVVDGTARPNKWTAGTARPNQWNVGILVLLSTIVYILLCSAHLYCTAYKVQMYGVTSPLGAASNAGILNF